MVQRSFIVLVLCLISNALLSTAFVPVAGVVKRTAISDTTIFSSEEGGEYVPEEQVPVSQQIPQQPPVPRQKRLDPLLASLTRQDPSTANVAMTNVPLFGEVPSDSVKVLLPIAALAFIGLLYSFILTLSSGDELSRLLLQVTDDLAEKAVTQPNQTYDPDVCRGICTPDQAGVKAFMESLRN